MGILASLGKTDCQQSAKECLIRWLAWATSLLYIFARFIPCTATHRYPAADDIDNAWTQALHLGFARHAQFGTDLVFTYGPWGFISRGYHPSTHLVSVGAWIILSLVFWLAAWRLARSFATSTLASWLWVIGLTAAASLPAGDDFNGRLIAWGLLLLFLHFIVEEEALSRTGILLAVSMGWLSLVKFTGLIETAIIVAVIAADNVWRQRRFPWILPVVGASLLGFWLAAGQHLGALGPYLRNSWRLTTGYTEAMMRPGQGAGWDIAFFLIVSAALCALIGWVAWQRHPLRGVLLLAGLAATHLMTFKHGYVRHDRHEIAATMALLLLSLVVLAAAWPRKERWLKWASPLLLAASVLNASVIWSRWFQEAALPLEFARTFSPSSLIAVPRGVFTDHLKLQYEESLARLRDLVPLPPINGQVDLYSWAQGVLFAHELPYQPRPIMHSYSAFTPELAELNAAHLRSDRAATNLLFAIQPIDFHFPSLEDGRSWPEILTRYDVRGLISPTLPFLLLTRSTAPRPYHLVPLTHSSFGFGEPVTLPSAAGGPIWAEIEINRSFFGNLVAAFYKPPVLVMSVTLRDGRRQHFRIIPGLGRAGFLLSPFIGDTSSFAKLASTGGPSELAEMEVASITIQAGTQSGTTSCYQSPIECRFYRLDFPR